MASTAVANITGNANQAVATDRRASNLRQECQTRIQGGDKPDVVTCTKKKAVKKLKLAKKGTGSAAGTKLAAKAKQVAKAPIGKAKPIVRDGLTFQGTRSQYAAMQKEYMRMSRPLKSEDLSQEGAGPVLYKGKPATGTIPMDDGIGGALPRVVVNGQNLPGTQPLFQQEVTQASTPTVDQSRGWVQDSSGASVPAPIVQASTTQFDDEATQSGMIGGRLVINRQYANGVYGGNLYQNGKDMGPAPAPSAAPTPAPAVPAPAPESANQFQILGF